MNDIYGFNAEYAPVALVQAKEMKLVVSGQDGSGEEYLVQNVNIGYSRPLQVIRELSSGKGYYNEQPPQGQISIERIVGTKPITAVLGAIGKNIWSAKGEGNRTISLMPIGKNPGPTYTCYGCMITNLTMSTNANQGLIPESVQIRFGCMEIK